LSAEDFDDVVSLGARKAIEIASRDSIENSGTVCVTSPGRRSTAGVTRH
jgi:hypothetical protein